MSTISSYIPTAGATANRNADTLPLPFQARPQVMTVYLRMVDVGMSLIPSGASGLRLLHLGLLNSNTTPRLELVAIPGVAGYQFFHANGISTTSVDSSTDSSVGDLVELRAILNADGSVQIGQTLNDGAETLSAVSSAIVLANAWAGTTLQLAGFDGTLRGFVAIRNIVIHRGVQSLETMRRLAGV